jgi:NADH:ubiquinone oxidoreductase subunit B-like Fe-S oxidoreductase
MLVQVANLVEHISSNSLWFLADSTARGGTELNASQSQRS